MTFSDLMIGDIFKYQDEDGFKTGVKISDKTAWLFEERTKQHLAHNRNVWEPDLDGGRLARDREERLCFVHTVGPGQYAGFRVVPVAFTQGRSSEYTLIKAEPGEILPEVDIILQRISQSTENLKTWTMALKSVLEEL